ncbi:MAG: alpha/beta hydrolase [Hungatella sp.]|nr:alpha/beta hydrolase [Hungatella sp.]
MALTAEQKQELEEILKRTGAHREAGALKKVIPQEYRKNQELVEQKEIVLTVPEAGAPVRCVITTAKDKAEKCPVHVNMHGGGFIFLQDGDDDLYCAHVAAKIRGIVVDIDYASSREHPYPMAFNQSYGVVKWVFSQCGLWGADPDRVSIGGHSAGGCLAAAISLKAAETGDFKVCLQVIDYGAIENYKVCVDDVNERSRAFSLYYADGDIEVLKNPFASPAYATAEMMKNQPRTLIVNAQRCPFCQVNEEYGRRLVEAGTEVTIKRFLDSRHGFTIRMADEWQEAQELIIREILDAGK